MPEKDVGEQVQDIKVQSLAEQAAGVAMFVVYAFLVEIFILGFSAITTLILAWTDGGWGEVLYWINNPDSLLAASQHMWEGVMKSIVILMLILSTPLWVDLILACCVHAAQRKK